MSSLNERRTLIIGDTHGHLDRLEYFLLDQNILTDCGACEGLGDDCKGDPCKHCEGIGIIRNYEEDVRVIHIGDLMHGGHDPMDDFECYRLTLKQHWIDEVVWGNHERGVIDQRHFFGGANPTLAKPTVDLMNHLEREGRMAFALQAHGFLLTHAGLGGYWHGEVSDDLDVAVDQLNAMAHNTEKTHHIVHAVSYNRGGRSPAGGILWRDDSEPISFKFNQVYGHTADRDGLHRTHERDGKIAYKIDIGGKHERRLGGLWLPDETLVKVDLGFQS